MAGFALSGAAAGAAGALEDLLKQEFLKQLQNKKLAEDIRQADMQHAIQQRQLGQGDRRIGLDERKLGEDTRQFDVTSGQTDRRLKVDEAYNPVRIANTQAETGEILRKPKAEQENRDFISGRDKTQHGYSMREIGAQGQNALRVANVRHPDASGAAATEREQNEVEDSLNLIKQIREDKALPNATGPIQGRGAGVFWGAADYERVKALHDNLVNKLSLAQAGKLKGQGPVSNFERDMLAKAATALTRKLGDPDYLAELGKVEQQFQRMLTGPRVTNAPGGSGAPKTIRARDPQGNLHEAPAGTPLPSGWKQEG